MEEAAKAQPQYEQAVRQNGTTMSEYQGIPGGENSHATYYDSGGDKPFALINRPCCTDAMLAPSCNGDGCRRDGCVVKLGAAIAA